MQAHISSVHDRNSINYQIFAYLNFVVYFNESSTSQTTKNDNEIDKERDSLEKKVKNRKEHIDNQNAIDSCNTSHPVTS